MAQPQVERSLEHDPVAERLWVEQFAMLLERSGFPRTAGRIFALMLITDGATTTQAELADRLQVSQASVSPALRFLVERDFLERTRTPGERREQYRLRAQSLSTMLHTAALTAETQLAHLERGLQLPGPDLSAGRTFLTRFAGAYRVLTELLRDAAARVDH